MDSNLKRLGVSLHLVVFYKLETTGRGYPWPPVLKTDSYLDRVRPIRRSPKIRKPDEEIGAFRRISEDDYRTHSPPLPEVRTLLTA